MLERPEHSDIADLVLDDMDLQVLSDVRKFLNVFHAAQQIVSAEKTPTLSIVIPIWQPEEYATTKAWVEETVKFNCFNILMYANSFLDDGPSTCHSSSKIMCSNHSWSPQSQYSFSCSSFSDIQNGVTQLSRQIIVSRFTIGWNTARNTEYPLKHFCTF